MTRHDKAFTLLELIMVVIIIGILVAVALPQYTRTAERARAAQMLPLLASIRGSEIRFRSQSATNVYTTTLANLDIDLPATLPTGWDTLGVDGTVAGSNVIVNRNGGVVVTADLIVDLDNGRVCASTAAAATAWGVDPPGC